MSRVRVPHQTRWLCLAAVLLAGAQAAGQAPVVTSTRRMSSGTVLRQINGRWWTPDNRMVNPPGDKSLIQMWQISSKPGVVEFHHHRPFDVRRAEQLRLFMTVDEVEAQFGEPNRRFPMRSARGGMWYYHGADGTILELWFMERDELGQGKYLPVNGTARKVEALERELNGRSIFEVMAARATELSKQQGVWRGTRQAAMGRTDRAVAEAELRQAAAPVKAAQKQIVAKEAVSAIQAGATKDELLAKLGEPALKSAITGMTECGRPTHIIWTRALRSQSGC